MAILRKLKEASRSNFLYVFLAWNAVGLGIFKMCKRKFADEEKDWTELNSSKLDLDCIVSLL